MEPDGDEECRNEGYPQGRSLPYEPRYPRMESPRLPSVLPILLSPGSEAGPFRPGAPETWEPWIPSAFLPSSY